MFDSAHSDLSCKCGRETRINNVLMPFEIRCVECGRKLRDAVEPDATRLNEEALNRARVRSSGQKPQGTQKGGGVDGR